MVRFIVRDFVYNEEELLAGKNEMSKLASDKKKQFVSLSDLFQICFRTVSEVILFPFCFISVSFQLYARLYTVASAVLTHL